MAKIDRFYIGQLDGQGQQNNVKPYAIPDDAFVRLNNAYIFRGRVTKRFGAKLLKGSLPPNPGYEQLQSRFRILLGVTDGFGAAVVRVPASLSGGNYTPYATPAIGQMFSIGDQIYTVNGLGTPATTLNTGVGSLTYDTSSGSANSGQVIVAGSTPATSIYFYPSIPVMGLATYEQPDINFDPLVAFDTRFAYQYTNTGFERLGDATWSGSDSQFFWWYNWRGANSNDTYLFVTNYVENDGIKYYSPNNSPLWNTITPIVNNTNRLLSSRIVIPFKDRLIALNTIEQDMSTVTPVAPSTSSRFSAVNTASSTGNFDQTVAVAPYGSGYAIGDIFIVGNTTFTINSTAASLQNMIVSSLPGLTSAPTAQFRFDTGRLVITGNFNNQNLPVYYFSVSLAGATSKTYVNRCRFSLNGNPTLVNGWVDQQPGLGGYIDAPTKEAIITAQFLKDRLIVYFEQSTWELVYTSNQVLPFVWQQINTELGAESTFSQVPFDKVVIGVGNVGIHACNGTNVDRIDDKIPDAIFEIHNANNGVERVYGIRDYYKETIYWTFPDQNRSSTFPYNNRVLVYNYKTGAWAFNDDSITTFGYFQSPLNIGLTWAQANIAWQDATYPWANAQLQARFKNVVAGNQEGFVFIINDDSNNSRSLQITDINPTSGAIVSVSHNLSEDDFIKITDCQGVSGVNDTIYKVQLVTDANNFTVSIPSGSGTYTGGGVITRVTPIDITTKQYNFYADQGRNAFISKVDFFVLKTNSGAFTVDYSTSSSSLSLLENSSSTGAILGTGQVETSPYALIPYEQSQERLWHPVYIQADGESIQMRFYLTDSQAVDSSISEAGFELYGFTIYATPTANRLQ